MTDRKRAANRKNAKKSTGPKTAAGKARSRMNGTRHGLRAEHVVVPQLEDAGEWEAHRSGVAASLAPTTYLEELLADRAALATWRLRRAARHERGLLAESQARAEERAMDALRYYIGQGETLDGLRKAVRDYQSVVELLEHFEAKHPHDEQFENGYVFEELLEYAAEQAGIPLEQLEDDPNDPEPLYVVPAAVFTWEEDDERTYAELLGDGLRAIAKHATNGATLDGIVSQTRAHYEVERERAEEKLAKLESAVALEREKAAVPFDRDDLFARYETSAERSLARALEGLRMLRAAADRAQE
jgi:hypothetical protein